MSTHLNVVQGTFRPDRANVSEPKLQRRQPPCPGPPEGKGVA